MHWTTELLNKYKEALVAFDTDYKTGYAFLERQNLTLGMCKYFYDTNRSEVANYIMNYVRLRTGRTSFLAPRPRKWGVWLPLNDILDSIKTRMQHLHKMREELNITEPLL